MDDCTDFPVALRTHVGLNMSKLWLCDILSANEHLDSFQLLEICLIFNMFNIISTHAASPC